MQAGEGIPRESRELTWGPSPRTRLSSDRAMHPSRDGEMSTSTGMPSGWFSWMEGLMNGPEPGRSTAGTPWSFPPVGPEREVKLPTSLQGSLPGCLARQCRSSTENVSVFFTEANISMCHCAAKHHATQGGRFRATSQRFGVRLGCGFRDVRATGSARAPRRKVRALRNSRECFTTRTLRCHVVCGKLHVPQKRVR